MQMTLHPIDWPLRAFSSDDSNRIKKKKITTNPQKHTASTSTNGHYSQAFIQ